MAFVGKTQRTLKDYKNKPMLKVWTYVGEYTTSQQQKRKFATISKF